MGLAIGIVGLPNVGKSTLFNALSGASVLAANYPFATKDPNVGVVAVPDDRLEKLSRLYQPKKTTPAALEFVDIAGLVKGASKGEGLGNQFLGNIRETDAIVHVVRAHHDPNVVHPEGDVNPLRDIETVETELLYADLEQAERRLDRTARPGQALTLHVPAKLLNNSDYVFKLSLLKADNELGTVKEYPVTVDRR